ncbi:hypothetical protein HNR19_000685 [Nocardioides thalensis]|uniref:Uncharacterized protein n=1 Tax=Nocardioides thalensis TaxID=1914755 RepID=A0A853BYR1_9ACTN|nr:hypothetical protein [Nocardioides thalensis]NYI99986.1 hypothetical protein [Nocardioides thalensis]
MDTETGPASADNLVAAVIDLRAEGYDVARPQPGVLLVEGEFKNPERVALQAAGRAADTSLGVWAISADNDWTLVAWNRPDLVTITQRGAGPQRWRHRRLPDRWNPDAQQILQGGPTVHEISSTPKFRATEAARAVLEGIGIDDPVPPGWEPPPPAPEPAAVPARKPARPRAAPKPKAPAKPEPVAKICPTCFMALPATGICDNCG